MNFAPIENVQAPAVTPATAREVMSRFATGVTVLGAGDDPPHAMTANAFTSVSLAPPTVLVCVAQDAVMHTAIAGAQHFGVSVLAAGQRDLARFFADKQRPLGHRQFEGVDWRTGPRSQAPLLSGALAWLECEVAAAHASGDHTIFVGTVIGAGREQGGDGLLFFDGTFQHAAAPSR